MIETKSDRFVESLQEHKCFVAMVSRSIKELEMRLEKTKEVSKYTSEVLKEISKIESDIEDRQITLSEAEKMVEFPIGSYVRNGLTRPGRVVDWVFAGYIPEVHVLWSGNTAAVPERPFQLKLLTNEDIEYIWNGDRFPKLVRRIDQHECDEVEILQKFLTEAIAYRDNAEDPDIEREFQMRSVYCKKRIQYLNEPKSDRISIAKINRDGGTQQRVKLNHETVAEYAEAMKAGDKFPPVSLTYDGTNYWLTDGFHTTEAAWSIGDKFIDALVVRGTQRDAILASVAVNANHGLRRTNADKRRAVTTLLEDKEWKLWSDREIARRCKVHHSTVAKIRQELTGYLASDNKLNSNVTANVISDNHRNYIDKYGNVSQMNTANIGSDNKKTVITDKPETVNTEVNCPDPESTLEISSTGKKAIGNQKLVEQFEIGQLVKLQLANFDGASENLKLANHSYGQITALTESKCSFNVKIFGKKSFVVSPEDLKPVDSVRCCVEFSAEQFIALMSEHQTKVVLEDAMKKGVLGKAI